MDSYYIVAGDLHSELVQYGLPARYRDNQGCIEVIVREVCEKAQCRGLILTGDTFNKRSLLPRHPMVLRAIHERIRERGKRLLAIDGNHDWSDVSWLDTIDPAINAHGRAFVLEDRISAFFSFQPRAMLYENLRRLDPPPRALFLHGRLLELMPWAATQSEPEYDFSVREFRELGLAQCTVFMGDIHTYADLHDPVADNWFVYSGSTEMTNLSEGNILSDRFGNRYDTVKKYLRFHPGRPPGQDWELADLPNRPFLKRVIEPEELPESAVATVDEWVSRHPQGILALHYPDTLKELLKPFLSRWRSSLLILFETSLPRGMARPLQEMKETDLLEIAHRDLSPRQIHILRTVLAGDNFLPALAELMRLPPLQPAGPVPGEK